MTIFATSSLCTTKKNRQNKLNRTDYKKSLYHKNIRLLESIRRLVSQVPTAFVRRSEGRDLRRVPSNQGVFLLITKCVTNELCAKRNGTPTKDAFGDGVSYTTLLFLRFGRKRMLLASMFVTQGVPAVLVQRGRILCWQPVPVPQLFVNSVRVHNRAPTDAQRLLASYQLMDW